MNDSGIAGPYAIAESAQTYWTDNVLGPVEFRNLSYRDTSDVWHEASAAVSECRYGTTSNTYTGTYPYGVEKLPGQNNHWLAGSGLPTREEDDYLWPWYYVNIESPMGSVSGNGWYVKNALITPQAQETIPINNDERYSLTGWSDGTSIASSYTADQNMTLTAVYAKQYLVTVSSTLGTTYGSGWYDANSSVKIRVTPTSIPSPGILGMLGVSSVATGWEGDYTGSLGSDGSSKIKVDSPMMIHAAWNTSLGPILPATTIAVIAVVTLTILHKRRSSIQYCLNCGHRLPRASAFCLECGTKVSE